MRQFFSEYSSGEFLEKAVPESASPDCFRPSDESTAVLEQLVQELLPAVPWGHHVELVKKVKAPAARLGWSRNVLLNQIKAAGAVVGISLLDHIVFNRTAYFSFLEAGKL